MCSQMPRWPCAARWPRHLAPKGLLHAPEKGKAKPDLSGVVCVCVCAYVRNLVNSACICCLLVGLGPQHPKKGRSHNVHPYSPLGYQLSAFRPLSKDGVKEICCILAKRDTLLGSCVAFGKPKETNHFRLFPKANSHSSSRGEGGKTNTTTLRLGFQCLICLKLA